MFGKASSSQQSTLSGSGTPSHVYIQFPPLRCSISGSSNFFYGDGSKLLLAATFNQFFSWKTTPFDPHVVPSTISISEGPVLSIRYSLDSKLLAVQRSDHDVQIWNREGRSRDKDDVARNGSEIRARMKKLWQFQDPHAELGSGGSFARALAFFGPNYEVLLIRDLSGLNCPVDAA